MKANSITGFAPIDDQHTAISEALAALVVQLDADDTGRLQRSLGAVISQVANHFAHEERLMTEHAFPGRKAHQETHAAFVADARRFQAVLAKAGVTPVFRRWATGRLPEWFRSHILTYDVGLAQFLLKAGVSAGS